MTTPAVELATVPDLFGLRLAEALEVLETAGLGFVLAGEHAGAYGVVESQDPAPGARIEVGGAVRIEMRRTTALYVDMLPQVLRSDERLVSFLRGFEDVGSALYDAAADFPQVFDPTLARPDVVRWMMSWIGVAVDGSLPDDRSRALAAAAMETFGVRGTAGALAAILEAATGGDCEIIDPGGVDRGVFLLEGGGYDEPEPPAELRVELLVLLESLGSMRHTRLEDLVESMIPAWLPYSVVAGDDRSSDGDDA